MTTTQTETQDDAQNTNDALETMVRQEAANVLLGDETDDATVPFSIETSGLSVVFTVYHDKGKERASKFANNVLEQTRARSIDIKHTVTGVDHDDETTQFTVVANDNLHASDKR